MQTKVSTLMDEHLFRLVKLAAIHENRQINELIGDAVQSYLRKRGGPVGMGGIVAETWAKLPLDRKAVKRVLEEEKGLFEA